MIFIKNMGRNALFLLLIVFLVGCGSRVGEIPSSENLSKRPKIPSAPLEADVLSDSLDEEDFKHQLNEINKEIIRPNITKNDMEQGWYYASLEEKKYGTPDSWVFAKQNGDEIWINHNVLVARKQNETITLCRATGGRYVISCIESEAVNCQHIPETKCECSDGGKWHDEQGCLKVDKDDQWIEITPDDIKRGWYEGFVSEKKLNTPNVWIWEESDHVSRWKNPYLR